MFLSLNFTLYLMFVKFLSLLAISLSVHYELVEGKNSKKKNTKYT